MSPDLAAALAVVGRTVVETSVVGAALGLLALVLRRPLRALPAGLQAWLWWLVSLRLLLQLAGAPALELAWLPTGGAAVSSAGARHSELPAAATPNPLAAPAAAPIARPLLRLEPRPAVAPSSTRSTSLDSRVEPWSAVGLLWSLGAAIALARLAASLAAHRRMLRASHATSSATIAAELARARRLVGISRPIALRRSPLAPTPLVTGLRRPTIVLPAASELGEEELRLALVHELVHVRRRDTLRALVPALVGRLLFFHPAARLAEREFALATEAACDAEALRLAGAPADRYGALLLRFALAPRRRAPLVATWPLAGRVIHRRLAMLAHSDRRPRHLALAALGAALAALVLVTPVRLVAGGAPAAPLPPSPPAEPAEPAPAAGARWQRNAPLAPVPPLAALPPLVGTAALAPLAPPAPPAAPELRGAEWLVLADVDARLSLHAPRDAWRRAEELVAGERRAILLLGRQGRTFVVRDAATIEGLRRLFFEQADAAREQAEAAREHARLALDDARLAMETSRRELAEIGRDGRLLASRLERLARLESERVAELERELASHSDDGLGEALAHARAAGDELERLQESLGRLRDELDRRRSEAASDRQEELGRIARERAERLERIDAEREELASRMERQADELAREIERRLEEIFERGLAAPLEP